MLIDSRRIPIAKTYNEPVRRTGLAARVLSPAARRFIAAIWFAVVAVLATLVFFWRLSMAPHAVILYIALPALGAGIAAYIWGGAILDSSKVTSCGQSVLRGFGVAVAAYIIFAALYGCGLPLLEGQWSLARAGSLFLLTLLLGILMGGPLAAISGMIAGVTLFGFGRHVIVGSGDPLKT